MAFESFVKTGTAAAKTSGKSFFSKAAGVLFKKMFIILFLVVPLLYAIYLGVAESPIAGYSYIAPRLIAPMQNLNNQSLLIAEQGSVWVAQESYWKSLFNYVSSYWIIISALYVIYKWNWLFYQINKGAPWAGNDSQKFANLVLAIMIFFSVQLIFLGATEGVQGLAVPFISIWNFFKAIPIMLLDLVKLFG